MADRRALDGKYPILLMIILVYHVIDSSVQKMNFCRLNIYVSSCLCRTPRINYRVFVYKSSTMYVQYDIVFYRSFEYKIEHEKCAHPSPTII